MLRIRKREERIQRRKAVGKDQLLPLRKLSISTKIGSTNSLMILNMKRPDRLSKDATKLSLTSAYRLITKASKPGQKSFRSINKLRKALITKRNISVTLLPFERESKTSAMLRIVPRTSTILLATQFDSSVSLKSRRRKSTLVISRKGSRTIWLMLRERTTC